MLRRWKYGVTMLLLIATGVSLCCYGLKYNPPGFHSDEAVILRAYAMVGESHVAIGEVIEYEDRWRAFILINETNHKVVRSHFPFGSAEHDKSIQKELDELAQEISDNNPREHKVELPTTTHTALDSLNGVTEAWNRKMSADVVVVPYSRSDYRSGVIFSRITPIQHEELIDFPQRGGREMWFMDDYLSWLTDTAMIIGMIFTVLGLIGIYPWLTGKDEDGGFTTEYFCPNCSRKIHAFDILAESCPHCGNEFDLPMWTSLR